MSITKSSFKRYQEFKEKYPNALLWIETADTLETFGEDAIKTAKILKIPLTLSSPDLPETLTLPAAGLDSYLSKAIAQRQRVAIATFLLTPPAR